MNLGALVTIAEKAPENLYHFVLDNECYATTGGQPVPNAQNVAYDIIAKGAGYPSHLRLRQLGGLHQQHRGNHGQAGAGFRDYEGVSRKSKTSPSAGAPVGRPARGTGCCPTSRNNWGWPPRSHPRRKS